MRLWWRSFTTLKRTLAIWPWLVPPFSLIPPSTCFRTTAGSSRVPKTLGLEAFANVQYTTAKRLKSAILFVRVSSNYKNVLQDNSSCGESGAFVAAGLRQSPSAGAGVPTARGCSPGQPTIKGRIGFHDNGS